MDDDWAAEIRTVKEARERADKWKWAATALNAQQRFDMNVSAFFGALPHYLDFVALHASFTLLGCLSEDVNVAWRAHQATGLDYRQFCEFVPQRKSPILYLPQIAFPDFFDSSEQLAPVPCLAVSDLDTSSDKEAIQHAVLASSQQFVLAYRLCFGFNPLPEVWERLRSPRITDGVELMRVANKQAR